MSSKELGQHLTQSAIMAATTTKMKETSPITTQVIVIGGGLSGLQAAVDLQKSGVDCVVLEARGRVGGKTWSTIPKGCPGKVEYGAAWTNSENQPRVFGLANELGIDLIPQNIDGDVIVQGSGSFRYGELPFVSHILTSSYDRLVRRNS